MGFIQIRRASFRGLVEALVQRVRGDAMEHDAKDNIERFQDYGFAANPVDGQGLKIDWQGHTIVLRMDRLAERPQLASHEVSVWHKEGHKITLKDGRLIEVECDRFVVNASESYEVNTKTVTMNASTRSDFNTPVGRFSQKTEVAQLAEVANLTMLAGGTAAMSGGTMNLTNMALNYSNNNSAYAGGSMTFNGKDITDTHTHSDVVRGGENSGTVT
ncbi:phage gp45-like [Variovorax boronicumulans]|uniref:phage baseplate assembly protein domain-containing protein n=1 Tax=Variovorax boronicumulans TaxID=436515 RepID=UPI00277D1FE8|nr:phage baseplate assembly protein [Variovorax boronicumulans]MDP9990876.1 phage gp45-like [Variovorax boronicumulans]MDQ0002904.1 phage gp45-like [Variovorax boronicumulans]